MIRRKLRLESLENRQLLAAVVIAPVDAELTSVNGSYLQFDSNGNNWYNGSGLSNASIVETNDPVPAVWPTHLAGYNITRVARIREAPEVSTLTFDLGGRFDLTGMALWNTTEATNTDRGFENTVLSYSVDNGLTFTGSNTLVWTQLAELTTPFGPEVKMLPATQVGVTHVRMNVDNFSVAGADAIVTASEIRFIGNFRAFAASASLSVATVDGRYDLRQGQEGLTSVDAVVTLTEGNSTGSPITLDLSAIGGGTASSLDYEAIAAGTKITVPSGSRTGTFQINVIDDYLMEATETLRLRISNPSNSSVTLGTIDATARIADNDAAGVTVIGADSLAISENGATDTYTIALDTIPTGSVQITASADPQIQISVDGVNFNSTLVLTFTDRTPQTITVRAVSDGVNEGAHTGTISHRITGPVVDPNYPNVTVESLYAQTGTDPTFASLIASGALPDGVTSTAGVTGSTINVSNTVLELAPYGNRAFDRNFQIHTLGNSNVFRSDFPKWTRWYQEDGRTQVYRIFEGEENTRNSREYAARIESFENGFQKGVWNNFSARYTILKPESMAIFQSFQDGVEWSVHLEMSPQGNVSFTHRRGSGGGQQSIRLADNMIGKSFDVLMRDNGSDYEVYFNGELKGVGTYTRPTDDFQFRWGMYRGGAPVLRDALMLVSGAVTTANTSAPVGLVPYRPATTSLSIASATATIEDFVQPQVPFIVQTVQPGTRILAEQFDLGGPGVAYFDTTPGNRGGQARTGDDVDLFATSIVLSDIADGEWLEYTRDIVPGIYDVDVQAWSTNNNVKGVRLLVAADNSATTFTEVGSIQIPNTNDVRLSHRISNVDLRAWGGPNRVLRVQFFGSNFSYDWIEFASVVSDVLAPTVTNIIASGSLWSPGFIDAVDGGGVGTGNGLGIAITSNAILPNRGIDRIYIQFSEPVLGFNAANSDLLGVVIADYATISTVSYDAANQRGLIQLSSPVSRDKLRIGVASAVTDTAGNALDGDSNGTAGGALDIGFNILVGDGSSDGSVNGGDLPTFANAFNTSAGNVNYNRRADWNSDGSVNGGDLSFFSGNFNLSLPTGEPGSVSFGAALDSVPLASAVDFLMRGTEYDVGNHAGPQAKLLSNATERPNVRRNQSLRQNSVGIARIRDMNKDGRAIASDTANVRQNQTPTGSITVFTAPTSLQLTADWDDRDTAFVDFGWLDEFGSKTKSRQTRRV